VSTIKRCGTCYYCTVSTCYHAPPTPTLVPVRGLSGDGVQVVALRPPVQAHEYCSFWEAEENLCEHLHHKVSV
jgi:hypothetical protein